MTTVDIILFCYKQEQYIEQALRSIYAQELPKDVTARIIVADDCSPDETLNIIKRLASASPFPMEFLPEEPNMGISKNYKRCFAATKSEYVAILEGDDYWLPNHLAQHMDFLQAHPECSLSMNEITFFHERINDMHVGKIVKDGIDYFTVDIHKQIVFGNQLGNLSACAIRGMYLRELPDTLFDMPVADWMLGIMMAQNGLLAILKGSSSVYRVKPSGQWAGKNRIQQQIMLIKYADMYDKFQQGEYHLDWKRFKKRCWNDILHNWLHYMPEWVQRLNKKRHESK